MGEVTKHPTAEIYGIFVKDKLKYYLPESVKVSTL